MTSKMPNSIRIKIAETEAEREAAYRLRYEVFGLEEGDHRYSDHERKFWIDQDDGPLSTIFLAYDSEGECLATTRLTIFRNHSFFAIEAYHLEILAPILNLTIPELTTTVGRWDRGVVVPSARGFGLLQMLEKQVSDHAYKNGCRVIVAAIKPHNESVLSSVSKSGYRTYPVIETYGGFTAQLIYKDLRENQPEIE